jgi:phosphohistidine swiveling domain-containing protein
MKWEYWGRWVQPVLSACFWDKWNYEFPFKECKIDGSMYYLDGHFFRLKDDKDEFERFLKCIENNFEIIESFKKWIEKIKREAEGFSAGAGVKTINDFNDRFRKVLCLWNFFAFIDSPLENQMLEICKKKGYDLNEIISGIRPFRKTFTMMQAEEARKLKNASKKEIEAHIDRFRFCGIHHFIGEEYDMEKFLELKDTKPSMVKEIDIPEELEWHAELASIAMYSRTFFAELSGMLQYKIRPILEKAGMRLGVNHLDLTFDELIFGLKGNKITIGDRSKYGIEPGGRIVTGSRVDGILEQLKVEISRSDMKGRVAKNGHAKGIVKVVSDPEDIEKVEQGDILVAYETSPEFFTGIKRAGAIITEKGGITSHAAIISREYGVPCIIGVAGITETLKDGDMVEVDAEKGIVRRIG